MTNTCPACKSTNTKDASIRENNGIYGPGAASWVVEEKSICNDCGVYFKPMANEPTIDDKNGVIAIFDGYQFFKGDPNHKCNFCFAGDEPCTPAVDRFVRDCKVVFHYELKYHTSWDALIPIIKKIKGMHLDILQQAFVLDYMHAAARMNSGLISLDIDKAHDGVYQFLIWYNQQKQKDDTER